MTAVDFNRSGVPLIEIVGEPDLRSPAEARAYLGALKQVLLYLEVSDCSMEEGSLRVDANVSVRPAGSAELRTRCEIKNLNSFANVERALAAERDRQIAAYERGGTVEQRTMTFDAAQGEVRPVRSKEESHDYRYFPEPDLPPLVLEAAWLAEVRASLPELPAAKRERFASAYGLSASDAGVVTATAALAAAFESFVALSGASGGKEAWNWFANDLLSLSADGATIPLPLGRAAAAVQLVKAGRIGRQALKPLLARMLEAPGADAAALAREMGLLQVSDAGEIDGWVREVLEAHAGEVARYKGGEEKLHGFLVGQVMKRSKGRADPKLVNAALQDVLRR
jgi:aspartyl-tRNA(Asn)/glutamyl-tRNA(Gln) amidotransferase subunit B